MRIQIHKRIDGTGLLKCIRDDGSTAYQKQSERHAVHFALHDLTHYTVETTMGYRNGFFGLVSQGWEMEDTTGKGARGAIPEEAGEVEKIVGLLDAERASGGTWSVEDANHFDMGRTLSAEEWARLKQVRGDLFKRWSELPVGRTLELLFP